MGSGYLASWSTFSDCFLNNIFSLSVFGHATLISRYTEEEPDGEVGWRRHVHERLDRIAFSVGRVGKASLCVRTWMAGNAEGR